MKTVKNNKNKTATNTKTNNRNQRNSHQKIAILRIEELFKQAKLALDLKPKREDLANEYIKMARKMALKYKIPFTKEQKMQFCKKCEIYLKPSINCRIRVYKGKIIILCLNCKNIKRFKYK